MNWWATHQILSGADVKLAKNLEWSFGIGIGTTADGGAQREEMRRAV
jgi:hypothetical protein